ncbi:acetyl-CoA acetyltransferase [Actibacterium mucosum KCTC 23349]|uniref:Acetyl-CoA acetyltransferase n=1 Tax=Actibacterium mucosum KCTC 23349 TaxID=1454373 RepID=A0A037ZE58_9RHOB|nr:acetyl-CoA acetyltransferase [Actibacterium mucosum]KAJ54387.1 acetyl-CoA acetyltransferase [Actibacterium mucosum KCTC 23349]
MDARIVGWGHTKFGRLEEASLEDMIIDVAQQAVAHAGIDYADVDGIWVGHFNSGLVSDGFPSSLALGASDDLRFTPATRVENACASGAAAVYSARDAIRSGRAKVALVIGAEKMTSQTTEGVTEALAGASYQKEEAGVSFPQIFARIAQKYFQEHGDQSATLARIAAKNHANALNNPLAHLRKDLGFEACNTVSDRNPLIAPPLRMTDCSLISDGAAALILAADDVAEDMANNIAFRAAVQVNDYLPMSRRDILAFEGPARAINTALQTAGATTADLSFGEVHDCFTIAELLIYEAMGLAPRGQGARAIEDGIVAADGALPINLSGGLKAKGHPVGATGVSMHVIAAQQLTGTAGDMQVADPRLGMVFNMGGSGVANFCSVLENAG